MERRLTLLTVLLPLLAAPALADSEPVPLRVDVFVASSIAVTGIELLQAQLPDSRIDIQIIDRIEQTKSTLSQNLPANAKEAKRVVLERMHRLGKGDQDRLRQSAEALLLALQLGVERYPAVVFERQCVVYGVTDLLRAYTLFRERKVEGNC